MTKGSSTEALAIAPRLGLLALLLAGACDRVTAPQPLAAAPVVAVATPADARPDTLRRPPPVDDRCKTDEDCEVTDLVAGQCDCYDGKFRAVSRSWLAATARACAGAPPPRPPCVEGTPDLRPIEPLCVEGRCLGRPEPFGY